MIRITRISNVKQGEYDKVYAPVLSLRHPSPWMTQIKCLAPSPVLFSKFQTLKEDGRWDRDAFLNIYVPEYLQGLRHSPEACGWLNRFCQDDRDGAGIALVCFCTDESLCHRSILAGLLAGAGCHVVTDGIPAETRYYEQFGKTP